MCDGKNYLRKMLLPQALADILKSGNSNVIVPRNKEELFELALGGKGNDTFECNYDINGETICEATVTKCKNGIVVNFPDITMRRRDPNSMIIADDLPTDKPTHYERFGKSFDDTRTDTFEWFKQQKDIIVLPFYSGNQDMEIGYPSLAIVPKNAAFFAAMLADLQRFIPAEEIPNFFKPKAIIYVAPPFRHTHYDGQQVVVHNRLYDMHEVFSYNLYPGPSAKKGVYSVLLNIGEQEGWVTLHASTVTVITPYELSLTIMHEAASGGGKSEMTEPIHRDVDGRVLLGTNIITGDDIHITISDSCELYPVTDDMALAHPKLSTGSGKLAVVDAENGWFLRVNHIDHYGTEPETEEATIHSKEPLIFLNMQAVPNSTCLIWEHIEDSPGVPCSNPRVIMPRKIKKNISSKVAEIDVRSFGIRTPPTTAENPNYGIIGLFHVLPPALAWIWRLVAPRGFANPSIIDQSAGMKSEGVGSYWPFAVGKMVDQANLLLKQILDTPETRYVLIPNQFLGAYKIGFAGEWCTREYLARRGGAKFRSEQLVESRCPILGYAFNNAKIDGYQIPKGLLQVNYQQEAGNEAYDIGAKILTDFFKDELKKYLTPDLMPLGRQIIEACLNDASVEEYTRLIPNM
ncbi:MAG: DUF4914 family protein [Clostridiales bacterium]|nr:DUF4914 family protein [Clostridiales bacterium]